MLKMVTHPDGSEFESHKDLLDYVDTLKNEQESAFADMINIKQFVELEEGKTYYIRVDDDVTDADMVRFNDNIASLHLDCNIIVGRGRFHIEEITDTYWGSIL